MQKFVRRWLCTSCLRLAVLFQFLSSFSRYVDSLFAVFVSLLLPCRLFATCSLAVVSFCHFVVVYIFLDAPGTSNDTTQLAPLCDHLIGSRKVFGLLGRVVYNNVFF